ncbi:MAG: RrF2 family transcriptional regulator [Smithellaceae bacterium]|nr:RrF2 family transcriptional regulator [Smithellaceae bacterium]
MQLSTKARYASRAMIELALHYQEGPLQLKEISKRQDISEKYLDQIMSPLRAKGYVYTHKGSQGGYCLAKPPDEITLYQIIQVVEGSLAPVSCIDNPQSCPRVKICVTRDVWVRLKERIIEELQAVTLGDLVREHAKKEAVIREDLDYHI